MIECPHDAGDLWERRKVLRVLRSKKKKWVAATFGVAVIGTFVAVALGSPPFGFTPTTLVTADFDETVHLNSDRVKFQTKDPTDVRVQKIVIDPGGYSGWHHHPGIVIVAVASGTVTVTHSDCSSKTYGPGLPNGAVFTEGGNDPMQASSTTGATNYVTFVAPSADPPVFRIEDDPPPCA
jgi:quercetin dioxygenase-like cupin family protein